MNALEYTNPMTQFNLLRVKKKKKTIETINSKNQFRWTDIKCLIEIELHSIKILSIISVNARTLLIISWSLNFKNLISELYLIPRFCIDLSRSIFDSLIQSHFASNMIFKWSNLFNIFVSIIKVWYFSIIEMYKLFFNIICTDFSCCNRISDYWVSFWWLIFGCRCCIKKHRKFIDLSVRNSIKNVTCGHWTLTETSGTIFFFAYFFLML